MSTRKAIVYAPGGTWRFLSQTDINRVRNGMLALPRSCNIGDNVKFANDLSYQVMGAGRSAVFRKQFDIYRDSFDIEDIGDNCYRLGIFHDKSADAGRPVFYWFGVRIVVECFDVNAIIDFTNTMEEGASIEHAQNKFVELYGNRYNVVILNEHLIEVSTL